MKEVYPVFEISGNLGRYAKLVCVFDNKDEAEEFCNVVNTPSHVRYTGSYLEVTYKPMFTKSTDAIRAANNQEITI